MQSSSDSTVHRKRRVSTTDKHSEESSPVHKIFTNRLDPRPDLDHLYSDNWSWRRNNEISSKYVQHLCPKTVFFHPEYSHGTAACIGDRKLTKEVVAYWEIHIEFVYGTAMMCGIGKDSSKLLSPILFETLIGGEDSNSYGLSHKGYIYHNGLIRQFCEPAKDRQALVVGILFDGPRRELSYFVDGVYLGVAFENLALDDAVYYPMISSTSQKSQFVVSSQKCKFVVTPLFDRCLYTLTSQLQKHDIQPKDIYNLGLPNNLAKCIVLRLNQPESLTEQPASTKRKCMEKGQEPMELDTADPIAQNELNYELISVLPTTIGERLMRILWARAMPSEL